MSESKNESSSSTDDESGDDLPSEVIDQFIASEEASVEEFYVKAERIQGISSEVIDVLVSQDRQFFDLLVSSNHLRKVTRDFFENASEHVFIEEGCRLALLQMVVIALDSRADICHFYQVEICRPDKSFSLQVIEEVDAEIRLFVSLLRPFVLTEKDIEDDDRLKTSVFNDISTIYRKVNDSRDSVVQELIKAKKNSESSEDIPTPTDLLKPQTSEQTRASEEGSEQYHDSQESQTSIITASTAYGSPTGKHERKKK